MRQRRPKFKSMWQHFSAVNISVQAVGKLVGGKVQQNIEMHITNPPHGFENACAIRMSHTLLHSGVQIGTGVWATVTGGDKRNYIYRVEDIKIFLEKTFGKPDKVVLNPVMSDFANLSGILIFTRRFAGATGHATLWNGASCSDQCYFTGATRAELWLLN